MKSLLAIPVFAALAATTALVGSPQGDPEPAPQQMQHQSSTPDMAPMVMDYAPREFPADRPLPKLAMHLYRDRMSGINLHLGLRNFQIGPPELALDEGVVGGHAHLYVNGKKVQRIYGRYLHLPEELFKPGVNLVMVSLNAHDHRVWQRGNRQILASSFVNLGAGKLVLHSFSSSPID